MAEDLERLKARIRALRAMTEANGCTEAEAMAAAKAALSLMQKAGIGEDDLAYEQKSHRTPGKRRQVIDGLWKHVAAVCRCHGWFQRSDDGLIFVYFGNDRDVLIAEYLHGLLGDAFRRETEKFKGSHEYLKRRKKKTRSAAQRAFQQGFVERVATRLHDLWWVRVNSGGDGKAIALAEAEYLKALTEIVQQKGIRLYGMGALRPVSSAFSEARLAGHLSGANVAIDPGLNAAPNARLEWQS